MPEINGRQWTREEIHTALREGRSDEVWPGSTFEDIGNGGNIKFADGSVIRIKFNDEGVA